MADKSPLIFSVQKYKLFNALFQIIITKTEKVDYWFQTKQFLKNKVMTLYLKEACYNNIFTLVIKFINMETFYLFYYYYLLINYIS